MDRGLVETARPKLNLEPFRGKELDSALKDVRAKNGLPPSSTNRLLSIETIEGPTVSKTDKIVPAVLMAGYIATFAVSKVLGSEFLPLDIPPLLHEALQAVHHLTQKAANNPTLGEHLPFIFLEAAGGYGGAKLLTEWFKGRKRRSIKEAQQMVGEEVAKGEFKYNMEQGHTAAFVGLGDPLADRLQQIEPENRFIQYSHARIDSNIWQMLKKNAHQEEIYKAFDRGDLKDAGEILLLPVKYEDMFLPDKTGHDMTIDEISSMINVVDEYSTSRGETRKKVIIVGGEDMEETYVRRTGTDETQESRKTLGDLVDELNLKREGAKVEIIDPTELVMNRIAEIANGKKLEFVATKGSDERYGQRFYEKLNGMNYQPSSSESARVLYNITDVPTEVQAGSGDIAVILDPSKKQGLMAKGLPEDQIIVVPDLTLQALSGKVDKS